MCAVCVWHCECNRCGSFNTRGPIWICFGAPHSSSKYQISALAHKFLCTWQLRIALTAIWIGPGLFMCLGCQPLVNLLRSVRVCAVYLLAILQSRTQIASLIWFTLCPLSKDGPVNWPRWENLSVTQSDRRFKYSWLMWLTPKYALDHNVIWWEYLNCKFAYFNLHVLLSPIV
jgi:hypothetical protein